MRSVLRPALLAVMGVALLGVASCNKSANNESKSAPAETVATAPVMPAPPPPVDVVAEQQAIATLNQNWLQVINNKDASASAAMYADDGGIFPPNAPAQIGPSAVLATWQQLTQIPNMSLDFRTTKITVAQSGDLAVDVGTYTMKSGDPLTPTVENGKYVVTWAKRNGEWKVLTDMFSSDAPEAGMAATGNSIPMGSTPGAPNMTPPMSPGATTSPMAPMGPSSTPAETMPSTNTPSTTPSPAPSGTP